VRALDVRTELIAVVTQPDRPAKRGQKLAPTPVREAAETLGVPALMPENLRAAIDEIRGFGAELFVVASYGKILPQAVLDLAPLGAFNVHPSLLPLYRGATPLQSAIRDGRSETGTTIILMDAGMDTGDILVQERTPLGVEENYGTLHDRLAKRGAELLVAAIDQLEGGTLVRTQQSAMGIPAVEIAATVTRPIAKSETLIDWSAESERIVDLVRSLAPKPGARGTLGADTIAKFIAVHVAPCPDAERSALPGMLFFAGSDALVRTGDGAVAIDRIVPPNRSEMSGRDFARSFLAAHKS
jgi:methionyl-tRNA formyltransferase